MVQVISVHLLLWVLNSLPGILERTDFLPLASERLPPSLEWMWQYWTFWVVFGITVKVPEFFNTCILRQVLDTNKGIVFGTTSTVSINVFFSYSFITVLILLTIPLTFLHCVININSSNCAHIVQCVISINSQSKIQTGCILISNRIIARPPVNGTNSTNYASHWCAWPRPPLWSAVVWPWQGCPGMGWKWQRSFFHVWCWSGCKIPS